MGERECGTVCDESQRLLSSASASSFAVSYVGRHDCRRATSARFSTSMRSRSLRRSSRLSEEGSMAAPNAVGSGEIQWSMTGTWLGVRRRPPVQSRVFWVGLRERRRILESLARRTVFSSSISANRSSWICARLRLFRTCVYVGAFCSRACHCGCRPNVCQRAGSSRAGCEGGGRGSPAGCATRPGGSPPAPRGCGSLGRRPLCPALDQRRTTKDSTNADDAAQAGEVWVISMFRVQ